MRSSSSKPGISTSRKPLTIELLGHELTLHYPKQESDLRS